MSAIRHAFQESENLFRIRKITFLQNESLLGPSGMREVMHGHFETRRQKKAREIRGQTRLETHCHF